LSLQGTDATLPKAGGTQKGRNIEGGSHCRPQIITQTAYCQAFLEAFTADLAIVEERTLSVGFEGRQKLHENALILGY
jgi:hypothetical protein